MNTNWITLLTQLLPVIEQAIGTICRVEGVTPEEAVKKLANHITPGKPNAPALAENLPPGTPV